MAAATESATDGSSLAPFSMVATTDLKTALGNLCCICALVNTFEPKISPGSSPATKLIAGGTYASTLLIACSRTAFPLIDFPSLLRPQGKADDDRPTLGRV